MKSAPAHARSCCTPRAQGSRSAPFQHPISGRSLDAFEVCDIPGGSALQGTQRPLIPLDEESPCRETELKPFRMMPTAVTNAQFSDFVKDTGFKTEAERLGWSFVFYQQLPDAFEMTQAVAGSQWWRKVSGACWNQLAGPTVEIELQADHPVVHVSWNDAKAFADWAGGWQGQFPQVNSCVDGYAATAPARSFEPNGYGLYNMCGNTWEWTSGRMKITGRSPESKQHAKHYKGTKLLKGGSFLCHKSYCFRYRIAARIGNTPDSTTSHQGFRLVFS